MAQQVKYMSEEFRLAGDQVVSSAGKIFNLPQSAAKYSILMHGGCLVCVGDWYCVYDGVQFDKAFQMPQHNEVLAVGDSLVVIHAFKVYFYDYRVQLQKQVKFAVSQVFDGYAIQANPLRLLSFASQEVFEGCAAHAQFAGNQAYLKQVFPSFDLHQNQQLINSMISNAGARYVWDEKIEYGNNYVACLLDNVQRIRVAVASVQENLEQKALSEIRGTLARFQAELDTKFATLRQLHAEEIALLEARKKALLKALAKK